MIRKMTSLAYGAAVSFILEMPMSGNNTKGRIETAGIGIASVAHHVIINAATASTLRAIGSSPKGLMNNANKNKAGPLNKASREPNIELD